MTLEEIKSAVENGKSVYWATTSYKVVKDNIGQWLVVCNLNDYCFGLTWQDGNTLNGKPEEFFIEEDDYEIKPTYSFGA